MSDPINVTVTRQFTIPADASFPTHFLDDEVLHIVVHPDAPLPGGVWDGYGRTFTGVITGHDDTAVTIYSASLPSVHTIPYSSISAVVVASDPFTIARFGIAAMESQLAAGVKPLT